MNSISKPYFMSNNRWYYYDEDDEIYKLTKEATEEARKSYEEFYREKDYELEEE